MKAIGNVPSGTDSDNPSDILAKHDPLIAMWAERQAADEAANAAEGEPNEDELVARACEIECQIARTAPTSPEGQAIVATILLEWLEEDGLDDATIEVLAGMTVARYVLASTPPEVLRRAVLEVRA